MTSTDAPQRPVIQTAGFDGFLIRFGTRLSEPANRAALAFRAALDAAGWAEVAESSTSLVSTYLRFDPLALSHAAMHSKIDALLNTQDWFEAPLPEGRRLWRVPTLFGGTHGPQLKDAAQAARLSEAAAITSLTQKSVRVQTIGFAPGMPYLGELSEDWNIPRLTDLTDQVPAGGLCVAIRQLVLFPVATPTGWRHIGQTALDLFRPGSDAPFLLRPGDEVLFTPTNAEALDALKSAPNGSATCEKLL